eukprot:TRINITY_DN23759_c0_g1_i1.p1 TRINITY_DN23759_c0_g1~~TRINITY_DN23759_c0_g1_i1.p1  ORF type:complete len:614 (-),score=73.55 TRINITY_DN23759_c0_g1_i1:174-2015(-)
MASQPRVASERQAESTAARKDPRASPFTAKSTGLASRPCALYESIEELANATSHPAQDLCSEMKRLEHTVVSFLQDFSREQREMHQETCQALKEIVSCSKRGSDENLMANGMQSHPLPPTTSKTGCQGTVAAPQLHTLHTATTTTEKSLSPMQKMSILMQEANSGATSSGDNVKLELARENIRVSLSNSAANRLSVTFCLIQVVPSITIMANVVVIGLSNDYPDMSIWNILELMFVFVYTAEIAAKLCIHGPRSFCYDHDHRYWNYFDVLCLATSYIDITVYYALAATNQTADLSSLLMIRMFRLARLVRLVRLVKHSVFNELKVMLMGLFSGARVIMWAVVLLFVLIYSFGILVNNVLGSEIQEFSNVPRAMFTMFRCFRDDCAAYDGTPLPARIASLPGGDAYMLFYILMIMVVSVGVFNLIMAIFLDNVVSSQQQRKNRELIDSTERITLRFKEHVAQFMGANVKEHKSYMHGDLRTKQLFLEGILDDDLDVKRESFQLWMDDPGFVDTMEEASIDISNRYHLFDVLDADLGGTLSLEELISGLLALRGIVSKSDIVSMGLKLTFLTTQVGLLRKDLQVVTPLIEHLLQIRMKTDLMDFEQDAGVTSGAL